MIRSRVRTTAKKVLAAVSAGDADAANSAFREYGSLIDSAARKGVYHVNTAARHKSRMARKVNAVGA